MMTKISAMAVVPIMVVAALAFKPDMMNSTLFFWTMVVEMLIICEVLFYDQN